MEDATYVLRPKPWHQDGRALNYDLRWVVSITSAYVDPLWVFGADTQVAAGDLDIDNEEGVLWQEPLSTSLPWSSARRANKVTLVAGFVTTPEEIIVAAAFAVRHLLGRGRHGGNVSSRGGGTRGGETITPADADALLPKATKDALQTYIRWSSRVSGGS